MAARIARKSAATATAMRCPRCWHGGHQAAVGLAEPGKWMAAALKAYPSAMSAFIARIFRRHWCEKLEQGQVLGQARTWAQRLQGTVSTRAH